MRVSSCSASIVVGTRGTRKGFSDQDLVGGLFLGYLAFFSVSLDSVPFGVAFSGLLSGFFLRGAVVGFGQTLVAEGR
jgi:hypothetical protein